MTATNHLECLRGTELAVVVSAVGTRRILALKLTGAANALF